VQILETRFWEKLVEGSFWENLENKLKRRGLQSFIPLLLRVPSETGRVALLGSMPWPAHYLKEILPELC
jgi:hypothetical protein